MRRGSCRLCIPDNNKNHPLRVDIAVGQLLYPLKSHFAHDLFPLCNIVEGKSERADVFEHADLGAEGFKCARVTPDQKARVASRSSGVNPSEYSPRMFRMSSTDSRVTFERILVRTVNGPGISLPEKRDAMP